MSVLHFTTVLKFCHWSYAELITFGQCQIVKKHFLYHLLYLNFHEKSLKCSWIVLEFFANILLATLFGPCVGYSKHSFYLVVAKVSKTGISPKYFTFAHCTEKSAYAAAQPCCVLTAVLKFEVLFLPEVVI